MVCEQAEDDMYLHTNVDCDLPAFSGSLNAVLSIIFRALDEMGGIANGIALGTTSCPLAGRQIALNTSHTLMARASTKHG